MRLKVFRELTKDLDGEAHILVHILGRELHLGTGVGCEKHDDSSLPYIVLGTGAEYTFNPAIEQSHF